MQTNCIGMDLEEDRIKSMNWFMVKNKFQEDTEVWIFLVENWWYDHLITFGLISLRAETFSHCIMMKLMLII